MAGALSHVIIFANYLHMKYNDYIMHITDIQDADENKVPLTRN